MTGTLSDQQRTQSSCDFRDENIALQVRPGVAKLTYLLQDRLRQSIGCPARPNDTANDPAQSRAKLFLASASGLIIATKSRRT